jgi:hypothetical protein
VARTGPDGPPVDALPFGGETGPPPGAVKIVAPAGPLILVSAADMWHSGTFNYSRAARMAVAANVGPVRGRDEGDNAHNLRGLWSPMPGGGTGLAG